MNAAKIIASSIMGTYYKEVKLGNFTFKIYQPTIKNLCNILNDGGISLNDNMKKLELIAQMPEQIEECARSLSYAISIKKPEMYRKMVYHYILNFATMEQIAVAFYVLSVVINGKELFDSVPFDRVHSENKAETVGANSIFGTLVSLMENLHLSYTDAFEVIPYPVMLVMSADKLRVLGANESKIVPVSGREFAERRRKGVK